MFKICVVFVLLFINNSWFSVFDQDMEKEAQNGIITTVSVHVGKAGKPLWKGLNGHYSAAIELGCQKQKLRIFAHNEAGPSQVPSEILIPPAEAAGGCKQFKFKLPCHSLNSLSMKIKIIESWGSYEHFWALTLCKSNLSIFHPPCKIKKADPKCDQL